MADEVRAIGMEKWGAEFVSPWDGRRQEFQFANAWNKAQPLIRHFIGRKRGIDV